MSKKSSVFDPVDLDSLSSGSSSFFEPVSMGSGSFSSNAFDPVVWGSTSDNSGHWAPVDSYGSRDKLSSHFTPSSVSTQGRGSAFSTVSHRNWGGEPVQNYPERHAFHGVSDSHYRVGTASSAGVGTGIRKLKKG